MDSLTFDSETQKGFLFKTNRVYKEEVLAEGRLVIADNNHIKTYWNERYSTPLLSEKEMQTRFSQGDARRVSLVTSSLCHPGEESLTNLLK